MNDRFIKLRQYSVGKHWKRCRLAICLELGFTNTRVLPELRFAKAALPRGLSVEKRLFLQVHLLTSVCVRVCVARGFLLYHTTSENSVSLEANILSVTLWSHLPRWLFFLKVSIYFYNLNSYYWKTKLRSLILAISITPFSCSVCIFIVT